MLYMNLIIAFQLYFNKHTLLLMLYTGWGTGIEKGN